MLPASARLPGGLLWTVPEPALPGAPMTNAPCSAAEAVEHLLALDLPAALQAAQRARAEAAQVRAYLRAASAAGADPGRLSAQAAAMLRTLERAG